MKRILAVLLLLSMVLALSACGSQSVPTQQPTTNHPTNTEEADTQKDKASEIENVNKPSMLAVYDANGNLEWYHIYTLDNNGDQVAVTSFDSGGGQTGYMELLNEDRTIERSYFYSNYHSKNGRVFPMEEMEYDAAGNRIKYTIISDGTIHSYRTYEYDNIGNLLRENHYRDGSLDSYQLYEYDENDRQIKREVYAADGTLTSDEVSDYSSDGWQDKFSSYSSDGILGSYSISEYDKDGHWLSSFFYNADGLKNLSYTFEYDDSGRLIHDYRYDDRQQCIQSDMWIEYHADSIVYRTSDFNTVGADEFIGQMSSQDVVIYNADNQIQQDLYFNGDGKLTAAFIFSYGDRPGSKPSDSIEITEFLSYFQPQN